MAERRLLNELYPLGFFGLLFTNTLFNQWIVYSNGQRRVGAVMLVGYVLQGLANPLLGLAGDRLRASFGTRRPLSLLAAPLMLGVFFSLWSDTAPVVLVLAYCLLFTTVMQPYLALLPSVAATPQLRLRMTLTGSFFGLAASGAALLAGPLLVQRLGFGALAKVGAAVFVTTLLVPLLVVREAKVNPADARGKGSPAELFEVLRRPAVARFVLGSLLLTATLMALVVSGPFVAGAVLHEPQSATAVLNGFLVAGMLVAVGLLAKLGKRVAPLSLMRAGATVGVSVLVVLGGVTLLEPSHLSWALCAAGFFVLGYLALSVLALPSLVVAKLADEDGKGREGVFFGLSGIATGFGNAVGAFTASSLLPLARDAADPTGLQATLIVAAVLAVTALFALPSRVGAPA